MGGQELFFFFCLSGESESLGKAAIYLRGILFYSKLIGGLIAQKRRGRKVDNSAFKAVEVMTEGGTQDAASLCTSFKLAFFFCAR